MYTIILVLSVTETSANSKIPFAVNSSFTFKCKSLAPSHLKQVAGIPRWNPVPEKYAL